MTPADRTGQAAGVRVAEPTEEQVEEGVTSEQVLHAQDLCKAEGEEEAEEE